MQTIFLNRLDENKGQTAELFENYSEQIKHQVAQRDIIFSNSMIESINKSVKYHHFFPQDFANLDEALKKVPALIEEYNNRPTKPLHGFTPNEAFEQGHYGNSMFSNHIKQAMKLRIEENTKKACRGC